jgi:hypothetical protein
LRASRRKRAPTAGLLSIDVLLQLCRDVGGGRLTGTAGAAVFSLALPLSGLVAYRYLADAGRLGGRLRASASSL